MMSYRRTVWTTVRSLIVGQKLARATLRRSVKRYGSILQFHGGSGIAISLAAIPGGIPGAAKEQSIGFARSSCQLGSPKFCYEQWRQNSQCKASVVLRARACKTNTLRRFSFSANRMSCLALRWREIFFLIQDYGGAWDKIERKL